MSDDYCETRTLNNVTVQENGFIRNSKGRIIGKLVGSIHFESEHLIDKEEEELTSNTDEEDMLARR